MLCFKQSDKNHSQNLIQYCGESRIRTCEDIVNGVTVRPRWQLEYLPKSHYLNERNVNVFEPMEGLEPTTC